MSLLYNLNESTVVEKVTMKWPSDEYVIPAGTPMSRTGIANDKNAIGILANEARIKFHYPLSVAKHIGKEEPKGKQDYTFSIITSGFVNLTEAEASFCAKISEEAKSAMGEINFVNETEPTSFGGGGGSNILETTQEGYSLTWDGNTDGLFGFDPGGGMKVYLLSKDVPEIESLENAQPIANDGTVITKEFCEANGLPFVIDMSSMAGGKSYFVGMSAFIAYEDIVNEGMGITIEKGVYFAETCRSLTIPKKQQIKEEYIPDSLKGGGGDSLFAEFNADGDFVYFGEKKFPVTYDIFNDITIVTDADMRAIWDIILNKIIYEKIYNGVVICEIEPFFGSNEIPDSINIKAGSDGFHLYSESGAS